MRPSKRLRIALGRRCVGVPLFVEEVTRLLLERDAQGGAQAIPPTLQQSLDGARASPRVLVLGAYAALRVRDGALEIEHGPHDDRQTIRVDIDAEPKPHTILFDSHGEFLTGEAIRWCARYSIRNL